MLAKKIKFHDYNGQLIEREFYFNLSRAEVAELEIGQKGGLSNMLKELINEDRSDKIFPIMKNIITKSIGKKSADGVRFIKNDEIRDEFLQTEAYSELLEELGTDDRKAFKFMQAIMPKEMVEKVDPDLLRIENSEKLYKEIKDRKAQKDNQ